MENIDEQCTSTTVLFLPLEHRCNLTRKSTKELQQGSEGKISSHYLCPKIICIMGFIAVVSFVGNSSGKHDHGSFLVVQMTIHPWNRKDLQSEYGTHLQTLLFSPAGLDDNKNLLPVVNSVMCFPLKRPSWEDLYSADLLYLVITVSH